ncbi:DUF3180 domain-containing protein [Tomitella fengzijianii]|uniref:DUF3180 domain-containing protein n=1 Tax=Tomitella fengzijianii TaxID=2597660 RepID=A0A516X7D1_9ACTN|nr:DUF3180 domain-containing protein [Tomitella fengzijianii]
MKATRIVDLALVALVFLAVGWAVAWAVYGRLPSVPTLVGLPLVVLAVAEALAGLFIRRRVAEGEVGAGLHDLSPLTIARAVVLAKASAIVGAVFAGGWAGFLIYLVPQQDRLAAARSDLSGTIFGLAAGLLLVAAALWLEHTCTVPPESRADGGDRHDE